MLGWLMAAVVVILLIDSYVAFTMCQNCVDPMPWGEKKQLNTSDSWNAMHEQFLSLNLRLSSFRLILYLFHRIFFIFHRT
jgi:hypothetical protein